MEPLLTFAAYFIGTKPVAPNGSCLTVGSVLDPYHVTDKVGCNASYPQYCVAGDLSGKHGDITSTGFSNT